MLVIGLMRQVIRRLHWNDTVATVSAVVPAKTVDFQTNGHPRKVRFELESRDEIRFEVPSEAYDQLSQFQRGQLTFQGSTFISFE